MNLFKIKLGKSKFQVNLYVWFKETRSLLFGVNVYIDRQKPDSFYRYNMYSISIGFLFIKIWFHCVKEK